MSIDTIRIPKTPSKELLYSMAVRYDHALALPGYYDQVEPGSHDRRLESTLLMMMQLYEEATGQGFHQSGKNNRRLKQMPLTGLPTVSEFDSKHQALSGKDMLHPQAPIKIDSQVLEAGRKAHFDAELRATKEFHLGKQGMSYRANRAKAIFIAMANACGLSFEFIDTQAESPISESDSVEATV